MQLVARSTGCLSAHGARGKRATRAAVVVRASTSSGPSQPPPGSGGSKAERFSFARRQTVLLGGAALLGAAAAGAAWAEDDLRVGEITHSDEEWKKILGTGSYLVLRKAATEPPFTSPLYTEKRRGTFVCAGCGSPLFQSNTKYESGTGWPSFYAPIDGTVKETFDGSIIFMPRTEVRCAKCEGHLGHVFNDGPRPTGMRYCMNGLALRFEPEGSTA